MIARLWPKSRRTVSAVQPVSGSPLSQAFLRRVAATASGIRRGGFEEAAGTAISGGGGAGAGEGDRAEALAVLADRLELRAGAERGEDGGGAGGVDHRVAVDHDEADRKALAVHRQRGDAALFVGPAERGPQDDPHRCL